MDKPFIVGWYECRLRVAAKDSRKVLWWSGKSIHEDRTETGTYDVANYTDFRGPLIEDHPAATALAFLLVKLSMRQLDAALIRKTCEDALAKCKGQTAEKATVAP